MTNSEQVSYIKSIAKNVGLTFKRSGSGCVNGISYYSLFERRTSHAVLKNYTVGPAFEDACSGYIESWNGQEFEGV